MNKCKWTLKRVLSFALAVMMIFTVPEVSAAVTNAEVEDAVENTETNEVVEEVLDEKSVQIDADNKEAANTANTIIYEEIVDLGETQTSAGGMSFFGADDYVSKTAGNHEEWIDRIQVSDDGKAFYNALVEGADNDGTSDILIDEDYYSATASNVKTFNYSSGAETCNVYKYTTLTNTSNSFDSDTVYAEMRAVYDAFDRDHAEVFWLSGGTLAAASVSYDSSTGLYAATYYFILKNHTEAFDVRATAYQSESAITTAIATRNNAVSTILAGTTATDTVELIKYFNEWLTKNNAYCTATTYPASSYECLSALTGSTTTTGPVCEGYARAFKVLCDAKSIPCVLVDGYATSDSNSGEAHMWNYVQVGTSWYAVDVTWNDPYVSSGAAISNYENEGWLLLGANTVVSNSGMTFIESHPVSNQASYNGVSFTNGPVLSEEAYELSDIDLENTTVVNDEVTYGYGEDEIPTVNVVLKEGATGTVTYQWYELVTIDGTLYKYELEGYTSNQLPVGTDYGLYYCQVYYDGEEVLYGTVAVYQKELIPTIAGEASKTYDGTTDILDDLGLRIELSGVVGSDDVTATAAYAYADANAGTNKTITATNIVLEGEKSYNYYIDEEKAVSANVGTIDRCDIGIFGVTLDESVLCYTGKAQTVNVIFVDENSLVEGTDYEVSGNTQTEVGENYEVTVTGIGNYSGAITLYFKIEYAGFNGTVKYNGSEEPDYWYNKDVVITAEGYSISTSPTGTFTDSYTFSEEGYVDGIKLCFKENETGYITEILEFSGFGIDKTAPSFEGENDGITVAENTWKKFLNTITFGLLFTDYQEVTVSATENGSGDTLFYVYIDETESTTLMTKEQLDALDESEFYVISEENAYTLHDGSYVIYAYAVDEAGNKSEYICTDGIVIDTISPEIEDIVVPSVNNGNLKDTSATISFTSSEAGKYTYYVSKTSETSVTPYENNVMVSGNNSFSVNDLDANTEYTVVIVAIDAAGNQSAEKTITFTTQKTLPTIKADPTIKGTYGQTVKDMTLTDGTASVEGTWAISSEATDVPEVGTTDKYVVIFTPEDTEHYGEVTVEVVPTVAKKAVTVTIANAAKVFGEDNPTFSFTADGLVGNESADVLGITLSTTATKTSDVGTYAITGAANAKNYSVTFVNGTLTIEKATAAEPSAIAKEYVYGLGSEGTASINLADVLPTDRGTTTYKVEATGTIVANATVVNDVLAYSVSTGTNGDTATITVTATSKNYEDITITVNIKLVDKLSVSVQGTVTTVGSLTYGDALSKLTFGEVTFVDTEGNVVAGTITWDTPNENLDAGTHNVAWTFTPNNTGKYKTATGTVSVTVAKATPNVATPTVEGITYNPSTKLADIAIISGTTDVAGSWSWKDVSVVPTVGNKGYVAVFTPDDAANYNTVEKTVAVEVAKATPVVSVAPTAEAIVYGETLADSALTGGTVDTDGTWAWKDATIAPAVKDSNTTEYEVVFTPADTNNYTTTTAKVKLVVEKAQWPANTPADTIAADYDWDTVGKVELPEGWEWAEEDAETALEFETEVTATANYVGDDKDNFVNLTKEIKITRNVDAPYIDGDETTMGWNAISDEMKETDEEEVRVDMNGHSVVSGDALETLKEENKTLVIVFTDEDGKEEYTWIIKGSDVEDGDIKALDMETKLFEKNADDKPVIPESLVNEATKGAKDHKFLSLTHDGEFGFKATLTINVGKENAGKLATLYYYNEETDKLLETENIKVEVDAEGNVSLVFEHASDYVLSINEKEVEQLPGGDDTTTTPTPTPTPQPDTPETGDGLFGNVYFYMVLFLAGCVAAYVGVRKKREN